MTANDSLLADLALLAVHRRATLLDVLGVAAFNVSKDVSSGARSVGGFGQELFRCRWLCRETWRVVQRGDVADLLRAGAEHSGAERKWAAARARPRGARLQLALAARRGDASLLRELIDLGAKLEARDAQDGATALHYAACRGLVVPVAILLEAGADANAADAAGLTPLDEALSGGHAAIARLLRAAGATTGAGGRGDGGAAPPTEGTGRADRDGEGSEAGD